VQVVTGLDVNVEGGAVDDVGHGVDEVFVFDLLCLWKFQEGHDVVVDEVGFVLLLLVLVLFLD
jgi:hypothetical protein